MNDSTPWNHAMTLMNWGKWALGALALNYYDSLIETAFWAAVALIALAVIADRLRTRRLLRRWDAHCQDIADHWASQQRATVTPLTEPEEQRAAA